MRAWLDGGWRERRNANSSYNEPLDPEEMLSDATSNIWAGQMPPDTIPIATDGEGDHLCLRINSDGGLLEVIAWHHAGDGWDHYGYSLAEAIAFDEWEYGEFAGEATGLSTVVAERRACRKALDNLLRQACRSRGGERLGMSVGVRWRQFCTWLHDPTLVPADIRQKLSKALNIGAEDLIRQDWKSALEHANAVIRFRPDLAWPYAVAGWAQERKGEINRAVDTYSAGAMALGSTASFTGPWVGNPAFADDKFTVQRLLELRPGNLAPDLQAYLDSAAKRGLRDYWLDRAQEATQRGEHAAAYRNLYSAGWDKYFSNRIDEVLAQLAVAAESSGSSALAALARWHLEAYL